MRELLNYRSAFEFVSECLDSGDPITEGMICEIHRKLVEGIRGDAANPATRYEPFDCAQSDQVEGFRQAIQL